MKIFQKLEKLKLVPERRLLEMWPPFLFMGVKVLKVTQDYRHLHLRIPLRFYGTNMQGRMFGGFICAVADPIAALLVQKIFPNTQTWTKRNSVDFLRPAASYLEVKLDITDLDVEEIKEQLRIDGQATHAFKYYFLDKRGRKVARVNNTVFVRLRDEQGKRTKTHT